MKQNDYSLRPEAEADYRETEALSANPFGMSTAPAVRSIISCTFCGTTPPICPSWLW